MHHLVGDGVGAVQVLAVELFMAKDIVFGKGDAAHVFHGPEIEFRDKNLVVLVVRIGVVEIGFQGGHGFPGDGKDVFRIHVFFERLPAVDSERYPVVAIFPPGIRAYNQGKEVGGKDSRVFEGNRYFFIGCSGMLRKGVVDIRPF